MSLKEPRIDHVVINVEGELDAAQERYRRLGFQLTPRGHHSLGTSNHLAIFGDDYLELIGYEAPNAARAAGQWTPGPGLAGLVFKTRDSDALHAELSRRGIALDGPEPKAFFRPVELPDGRSRDARFRTVRLDPAAVSSGRIFFCHHLDPDLVWRPEWQAHANGARDIRQLVIEALQPAASIQLLQKTFGAAATQEIPHGWRLAAGRATVDYLTPEGVRLRFGDATPVRHDERDRKVALVLGTDSLAPAGAVLQANRVAFEANGARRLVVPAAETFGLALVFSTEEAQ